MKSPLIVALLALAVSAVGFTTVFMNAPGPRSTPSKGSRGAAPEPAATLGPGPDLLARIGELAQENRELRDRLTSLELRPAPEQRAPVTGAFVSREEFDAFRDELLASLGGSRRLVEASHEKPPPMELEDFREHVAGVLYDIRKQEAVAKFRSLDERTAELDEDMPRFEEWLELTRDQSDRMRSVLLAQYEREADIIRRWEEGEDPEVLGAMKRNDREVHREELAEVLTPEQFETYTSRMDRAGGK